MKNPTNHSRVALVAAGALTLAASTTLAQQYRLQHTNSINLAPSFFGPGPLGEPSSGYGSNPLNVTFDGTHAYVGGFNNSGVVDNVGIVRVDNVLSLAPTLNNLAASQIIGAPVGRGINGLDYSPTSSSVVYAFDSGAAGTSVISNRNAATGAEIWSITNPQSARPFALAIDPLGDNGNPGVAFLTQGSGRRRLISLANGSTIFDGTNGGIINGNPAPPSLTTWRSIDFDPQGNIALGTATAAQYGLRTTNNQWSDLAATPNVTARSILKSPDANFVGQSSAILNNVLGGTSDLLAFNARTLSSGDTIYDVSITPLTGAPSIVDARNIHIRNTDGSDAGIVQPKLNGAEDGVGTAWTSEPKELAFGTDANGLPVLLVVSFGDRKLDVYSLEPTWTASGGGLWDTSGNWLLGAVPNSALANARFGESITAPSTITIDAGAMVKVLKLDTGNSITFDGGGVLEFDSPGTPMIQVSQGNHTIDVPVNLLKDTQVSMPANNTLSAKWFGGTGLTIDSGTVRIIPNGTVVATSNLNSLTIAGGTSPTAKLDLTNNALVVDYTTPPPGPEAEPYDTIKAQIISGYNNGAWTGNGITSNLANATTHGIGYAEASALTSIPAVFGTVDADAVLVRYTRHGDADLSGTVNLDDFNILASNFNTTGKDWVAGNFNYDANGDVGLDDFNLLAGNFNLSAGPDGVVDPEDWAALAAAIPEPSALLVVGVVAAATMWIRRRRG